MSGTYSEGFAPFLVAAARQEGFADATVISVREIYRKINEYSKNYRRPDVESLRASLEKIIENPQEGSFLVCALPYAVRRPVTGLFPGPPPYARVAPFASRHYYRAAVEKLDRVAEGAAALFGMELSAFRPFSNSRIPEKPVFWASGLGMYGRNGLIIHPELGTRFVIALLFVRLILPATGNLVANAARIPEAAATSKALRPPGSPCGGCTKCSEACPANALAGDGSLDTSRCLQARATRLETWDEETKLKWGMRIYGCDICQEMCPQNRNAFCDSDVTIGVIGECVSLPKFLALSEGEMKAALKTTALGMSWIPLNALVRNALVALGNALTENMGAAELSDLIKRFHKHTDPSIADAAEWVLEKLEI